ncbi:MAG: PP2C family serine/threonine-protein phosphatase [Gammaproteobacteria bacterium]|nr:PP2C family serine/threonine-protein phosphatase [Gammaproteobacteria bacterium]
MHDTWQSWGASLIGPAHARSGIQNQDSWIARKYIWGNVVVVADGLGSKPHSGVGSKAVCMAVVEASKIYRNNSQEKPNDLLRLVHSIWRINISPFSVSDCATTCLFALQINELIILGRLGDGMICVIGNEDKNNRTLSDNKHSSFSNYTDSLRQNFDDNQWEIVTLNAEQCNAILLCTDGISDDLLPEKKQDFCKSFITEFSRQPTKKRNKSIKKMLNNWPVPHHSDDKTIACLMRVTE